MYLFWSELYHVRKIVFTVSRITDKQVFHKENLTFHRMTIKLERTKKIDLHTFFISFTPENRITNYRKYSH